MLEKPSIEDEIIRRCLEEAYGFNVTSITFLPLGADVNTAVYKVETANGSYFVKLRYGDFSKASVTVPNHLVESGIRPVIPIVKTRAGGLWTENISPYLMIVSPFMEGRHGYQEKMTEAQWAEFGAALKSLHAANIPLQITADIPQEDFSSRFRDALKAFLDRFEKETFDEPAAAALAAFLRIKRSETLEMIERTSELAQKVKEKASPFILCHADIHGWNLLIDTKGKLYIVDWDTLIYAPRERDLMFIGGGLANSGYTPEEEQAMFYKGYGNTEIDPDALAYYRCERIIEDIAAFCEQVFLSAEGSEDRGQAVEYVKWNFRPGGTIERAYTS
jgi:spectinomycin phosphotransferase